MYRLWDRAIDDFRRGHAAMIAQGIVFVREPIEADYGIVAVFVDLYGNRWDLVQFTARDTDGGL